jgi:hypothetical protein
MKKPPPVKAFANRNLYASAKHHAFPACGTLSSKNQTLLFSGFAAEPPRIRLQERPAFNIHGDVATQAGIAGILVVTWLCHNS